MPLNDEDEFSSSVLDESTSPAPVEIELGHGGGGGGHGRGGHGGRGSRRGGGPLYGGLYWGGPSEFPFDQGIEVDDELNAESIADKVTRRLKERHMVGLSDGIEMGGEVVEMGNTEIGSDVMTPWDAFMSEPVRVGNTEIGNTEIGNVEIGAITKVVKKARDNRRPAPKMRAVDVDAPHSDANSDWGLTDVFIGAFGSTGNPDPFPLTSALLVRFGAGGEPRFVRVDTEATYKQYRESSSPQMTELRSRMDDISSRLASHEADPHAHEVLLEDVENLTLLGEEVKKAEVAKHIPLKLDERLQGLWDAWIEGDFVYASIRLPGADGEVRICTSMEPVRRCVAEMARHASEAGVPAAAVLSSIPTMGTHLGAGTILKELAAAAPSLLQRPEAARAQPFFVRIEPKANPALCALAALAQDCSAGNKQACDEWQRLSDLGPASVKQAMGEALQLVKTAATKA